MTPTRLLRHTATTLTLALATAGAAHAGGGWIEAVNGDFSGDGLAPTVVPVTSGLQAIQGTTGRAVAGGPVDRDYFTMTIPAGFVLESITVLPGTVGIFDGSFIGLMAGAQFTVPPDAPDATGLLGWALFGENQIGDDILIPMSFPLFGSSGFERPLAAGTYTFWIQETGVGVATYNLAFDVTAVPEAPTALAMLGGLALLSAALRRRG